MPRPKITTVSATPASMPPATAVCRCPREDFPAGPASPRPSHWSNTPKSHWSRHRVQSGGTDSAVHLANSAFTGATNIIQTTKKATAKKATAKKTAAKKTAEGPAEDVVDVADETDAADEAAGNTEESE